MNRVTAFLLLTLCLCSIRAQEVVVRDSVQADIEVPQPTALPPDSQNEVLPDTIEALQREQQSLGSLLRSWKRSFPLGSVSHSTLVATADRVEVIGSPRVESLLQKLDSIPYNKALSSAQGDMRLPLVTDAKVPESLPTLQQFATSSHDCSASVVDIHNPFAEQLAYGLMRSNAINTFAASHVDNISRVRTTKNSDVLDFSRQHIARKAFEATELVISDAALDLGTATLDIEQVTFHADKWHRKGSTSLQLSQTSLSSNWYKGGDNNMTLSTYDKLTFSRYDESLKTTLDIAFELRLSGYYTAADTINPVRVNDNQMRMDVNYGYKAWKNWYYSTSFYAKTPIFDFHSANSKVTKSTLFSPLETNLGIGLEYKKQTTDKKVNLNLMLAPLSYSVTAVLSDRVNVKQFGLEEGEKTLHQFGSSLTCKLDWKITDLVSWNTRVYYFTTYEKVLVEFENNVNIQLGKYCSAKFYYYPRLDDSRDDHFECKQMLTFGLSWMW